MHLHLRVILTLGIQVMELNNQHMGLSKLCMVPNKQHFQGMVLLKLLHTHILKALLMDRAHQEFLQLSQNLQLLQLDQLHIQANNNGELLLLNSISNIQECNLSNILKALLLFKVLLFKFKNLKRLLKPV